MPCTFFSKASSTRPKKQIEIMHWLNKPMHFPLEVEDALRIIVTAVGLERFFQTVVVVAVFRRVAEAEVEITNGPS